MVAHDEPRVSEFELHKRSQNPNKHAYWGPLGFSHSTIAVTVAFYDFSFYPATVLFRGQTWCSNVANWDVANTLVEIRIVCSKSMEG